MKKNKIAIPCPELTLSVADRRRRNKHMTRIKPGVNALTKRQIKRLPRRDDTKAGLRKARRQLHRYAKCGNEL